MTRPATNTVWARAIIDELARCGLKDVIVAPGSRSTPLVMAADRDPRVRVRLHLDERSAAFFALGLGQAGRPAAVVTTSGTAVANLLPAVVEACQASVPLIALTADRPPRLRGSDANQAIEQRGIFGVYPRESHELSLPDTDPKSLEHLRSLTCRVWGAATGRDPGPVHLNVPFEKPLEPIEPSPNDEGSGGAGWTGRPDGAPWTEARASRAVADEESLAELEALLAGERPVLVAGPTPDPERLGPAAVALARRFGCPLLADPLSGARFLPGAEGAAIAGYDLALGDGTIRGELQPTAVVRLGRSPVSANLQRWLFDHAGRPQVVVDDGRRFKDHGATAHRYCAADAAATLNALLGRVGSGAPDVASPSPWLTRWLALDEGVREATSSIPETCEGAVAAEAHAALPDHGTLFVSNSMPIRDIDAFAHPSDRPLRIRANRGASGIDGVVSTAFGVAAAVGPTVCLIGDVAFFHDLNGLLWSREPDAPVVFVVVDNDGGGIFRILPIADHEPAFTTYFATPHGIDFESAAAVHGIPFEEARPAEVGERVKAMLAGGSTAVLHVRTDQKANHVARTAMARDVVERVRRSL
ncbi:MAG: 2-succinyl-5-enolpyruvyl-6-hydroxy-3-cyclohexene-1-carboxylic-acid synthase [Gemmatimonadota bacterium]